MTMSYRRRQGLQLLTLLSLCYAFAYNECPQCYCCKGGAARCIENYCYDGCIDGYFSSTCRYQCSKNCKTCSDTTSCYSCKEGYYNGYDKSRNLTTLCEYGCPRTCVSCSSFYVCDKCIDGKLNDRYNNCSENCSSNCKACNHSHFCSKCDLGKFGYQCEFPCGAGCQNNLCDFYGGKCTCKLNFTGEKCDTCVFGKYGLTCNISCPPGCDSSGCFMNGTCKKCNEGFTGIKCSICSSGYYGDECEKCRYGCANESCKNNGDCFSCRPFFKGNNCDQCIDGMYGIHCNQKCPVKCNSCITATNCTSCKTGHWGNICKVCPTNCLNCSSDRNCSSCVNGFYGQTCNGICSSSCLENLCDKLSGSCIKGCIEGYHGDVCNKNCSSICVNSKCGRQSGECLDGCKTGYTGEKCNLGHSETADSVTGMAVALWAGVGSAAFVLIIAFILIPIIIIRKRRQRGKRANDENNSKREKTTEIEVNDRNLRAAYNHTDENVVEVRESVTCSYNIKETEHDDVDVIYAKPIKPKRKFERAKSSEGSSFSAMDKNPGSDNENTDGNNAALEIEEDIETLSTRTKSVILEENARRAAELDSVDTYYNVGAVRKRKIKIDHLYELVIKKTGKDFTDEFQTLPAMLIKPYVFSQKPANISKNRYKGIYPYDDTRVVLNDGESDYINASYIDGYNQNKTYIASIGPTTRYMGDMSAFWMMVWQEKVGKIVMLSRLLEGEVAKCDKYWPEKDFTSTFADIQVTCLNEEEYSDYIFRTFSVQKDSVKRNIFHLHFTAWPDKGTPDDVTSLIEFRQKVNRTKTQHNGPLIVHCSAGIGRTGTYIALDSVTKEGEAEGEVDIYACVRNMREQRVNMIQTAEQYEYLHNALVHTLTFDSDAIEACKFGDYMKRHTADHLGKMFEKLQASVEQRSAEEMEAVKRNRALKDKNRDGADIPGDRNRPKLNTQMTRGSSDYINAIYVNSFRSVNRFLIAQTPLPNTVEDFLTLIVQEKVSCVISMDHSTSGDKDIGIFCPVDNQTLNRGTFTVKCEPGNVTDLYLLRKIKISYSTESGSEEVTIPHVQFTQWGSSHIAPGDHVKFVKFINEMELKFGGKDLKRPILVHCSTGASRSGLYCVLSILLEKIQINQEVSVVNTVRQIKYRRHMAIPNKDQYIFCHQCVNEYLNTFETYSNFSPVS